MYYKTGKLNSFSEFRIHTGGKKKEWYVGCVTARAVHVEVYAHVPMCSHSSEDIRPLF